MWRRAAKNWFTRGCVYWTFHFHNHKKHLVLSSLAQFTVLYDVIIKKRLHSSQRFLHSVSLEAYVILKPKLDFSVAQFLLTIFLFDLFIYFFWREKGRDGGRVHKLEENKYELSTLNVVSMNSF